MTRFRFFCQSPEPLDGRLRLHVDSFENLAHVVAAVQ